MLKASWAHPPSATRVRASLGAQSDGARSTLLQCWHLLPPCSLPPVSSARARGLASGRGSEAEAQQQGHQGLPRAQQSPHHHPKLPAPHPQPGSLPCCLSPTSLPALGPQAGQDPTSEATDRGAEVGRPVYSCPCWRWRSPRSHCLVGPSLLYMGETGTYGAGGTPDAWARGSAVTLQTCPHGVTRPGQPRGRGAGPQDG